MYSLSATVKAQRTFGPVEVVKVWNLATLEYQGSLWVD
jgi:hypothetical protein